MELEGVCLCVCWKVSVCTCLYAPWDGVGAGGVWGWMGGR